jgi:hypothetical protein
MVGTRRGHNGVTRKLAWLDNLPEEWQDVFEEMKRTRATRAKPQPNGIRIVFEPKAMGGLWRGERRWLAYLSEPTRVRTCRGSRR